MGEREPMSAERLAELRWEAAVSQDDGMLQVLDEVERLRAEVAARQEIVDDLRDLVDEADREPGGMRVPWCHALSGAVRVPSVVRWARGALRRCERREPGPLVPDAPGWWWWRGEATGGEWEPQRVDEIRGGAPMLMGYAWSEADGEWGGRCQEPRRG